MTDLSGAQQAFVAVHGLEIQVGQIGNIKGFDTALYLVSCTLVSSPSCFCFSLCPSLSMFARLCRSALSVSQPLSVSFTPKLVGLRSRGLSSRPFVLLSLFLRFRRLRVFCLFLFLFPPSSRTLGIMYVHGMNAVWSGGVPGRRESDKKPSGVVGGCRK